MVHPGHARKMAAKMESLSSEVLFYESSEGGHSGCVNYAQWAFKAALKYAFFTKELFP